MMDKSLPKQSVIYISHAGYNPLYIAIHPKWIRTDLFRGKPREELRKHFNLWQDVVFHITFSLKKKKEKSFVTSSRYICGKTHRVINMTTRNVVSSHVPIIGQHSRRSLPIPSFIKQTIDTQGPLRAHWGALMGPNVGQSPAWLFTVRRAASVQ